MTIILGVFPDAQKYPGVCSQELELLSSLGFSKDQIYKISDEQAIKNLFEVERQSVIIKYAGVFTIALTITYALVGLIAGVSGFFGIGNILAYSSLGVGELVVIFFGFILGAFIGDHKYNMDVKLIIQVIRMGAKVIAVETSRMNSAKARRVLELGGARTVLQY
jgi:hypothetical protein